VADSSKWQLVLTAIVRRHRTSAPELLPDDVAKGW